MTTIFKHKSWRHCCLFILLFICVSAVYMTNNKEINSVIIETDSLSNEIILLDDELPWWERQDCRLDDLVDYEVIKAEQGLTSKHYKNKKTQKSEVMPIKSKRKLLAYDNWKKTKAVNHTCGWKSWKSGAQQRVISYSIYGKNPQYWEELEHLLISLNTLYPGWKVRIYTDPRELKSTLCPLIPAHSNLYICDVASLPPPLGNVEAVYPRVWRNFPLQDLLVDLVLVRDTDAMVLQREVDAVNEWLLSGKSLHVMRDHPHHGTQILAGMWGVRITPENREAMYSLSQLMGSSALGLTKHADDQNILSAKLWPKFKKDMMSHDSYLCKLYPYTRPWPTQRQKGKFVGNADYKKKYRNSYLNITCPESCRPVNHKSWVYC